MSGRLRNTVYDIEPMCRDGRRHVLRFWGVRACIGHGAAHTRPGHRLH